MIGLDTNVLVRFLTHDDSTQTAVVTKLLASLSPDSPGYVSLVVLVELIWVLDSFYRFKRNEIGDVIETLLRAREIVLEHPEIVEQALRKFKTGNADFADFIIDRSEERRVGKECRSRW